jgi:hypothetical protein
LSDVVDWEYIDGIVKTQKALKQELMVSKNTKQHCKEHGDIPKYLFIFDDMLSSNQFNRGSRLAKFVMHS